jgi:hypothetical protein
LIFFWPHFDSDFSLVAYFKTSLLNYLGSSKPCCDTSQWCNIRKLKRVSLVCMWKTEWQWPH